MTNYKEILRLQSLGINNTRIAEACGCARSTVISTLQIKLLILDEYLLFPLKESEARDLLEIVEARHKVAEQYSAHSLLSPGGMPRSASPRCPTPSVIVSCTIPIQSR